MNNIFNNEMIKATQINKPKKLLRIKEILDAAKEKELFKDIKDPVEWQKNIRKDWEREITA